MKELFGYLAYRGPATVIGMLPGRLVPPLGRGVGRLAFPWAGDRRRMAERHMRRVLGPQADARRAAREAFANYGRYWAEVFWIGPRRMGEVGKHVTAEGLEHVREARQAGRGLILALPHVGNWEVAGPVAAREGLELTAVAESLPNPRVTEWFVGLRARLGIEVLLTRKRGDVARLLVERLERGGAVALLSDRDISGGGVRVRFFGEETTLPAGPAALAERTGAAVLPVAVYFREGRGHHAVVRPALLLPDGGSKEERVRSGMQMVAEALEQLIRAAPMQWHLVQPNWPSDRADPK
ncbi:MAG: phosphatidylinositol mannoside acyltransferase [Actinomycetota bacterium]|nr:phosphatidylinositol mannoside acyltransferase [Actinomycetota bacterium]